MEKQGYKMSEAESVQLLREWGEELEVDVDSKEFEDVVQALKIPVRKENLGFDAEKRQFGYVLFYPIEKKDGSQPITKLTIQSTTMEEKRGIQNYKESQKIDQALAMIAESTGLDIGFAGRLKDKDITRINAVVMGFFV